MDGHFYFLLLFFCSFSCFPCLSTQNTRNEADAFPIQYHPFEVNNQNDETENLSSDATNNTQETFFRDEQIEEK